MPLKGFVYIGIPGLRRMIQTNKPDFIFVPKPWMSYDMFPYITPWDVFHFVSVCRVIF